MVPLVVKYNSLFPHLRQAIFKNICILYQDEELDWNKKLIFKANKNNTILKTEKKKAHKPIIIWKLLYYS